MNTRCRRSISSNTPAHAGRACRTRFRYHISVGSGRVIDSTRISLPYRHSVMSAPLCVSLSPRSRRSEDRYSSSNSSSSSSSSSSSTSTCHRGCLFSPPPRGVFGCVRVVFACARLLREPVLPVRGERITVGGVEEAEAGSWDAIDLSCGSNHHHHTTTTATPPPPPSFSPFER
ncbi:hypothetical protein WN55_00511 [Dufourea novaeangliae]|uniref:Uncharacterized protein n=1 Tax=Dufourea novaeangliae TaxID=178035 RepID=A0A154PD86_DUFNO|nr:hypothetical protein WN55_00511 [Dufourea novaeangliae]